MFSVTPIRRPLAQLQHQTDHLDPEGTEAEVCALQQGQPLRAIECRGTANTRLSDKSYISYFLLL